MLSIWSDQKKSRESFDTHRLESIVIKIEFIQLNDQLIDIKSSITVLVVDKHRSYRSIIIMWIWEEKKWEQKWRRNKRRKTVYVCVLKTKSDDMTTASHYNFVCPSLADRLNDVAINKTLTILDDWFLNATQSTKSHRFFFCSFVVLFRFSSFSWVNLICILNIMLCWA